MPCPGIASWGLSLGVLEQAPVPTTKDRTEEANMTKRGLTNTAGTIVAGALLAACGVGGKGEKPAPVTGVTPVVHATRSEGVINGTLLYSTEPRPGHLVEFYDFGDGATAVHE